MTVTAAVGMVGLVVTASPSSAAETYPVPASGSWTVDGRGFGHGRGLSQWGAQGAAQQGRSATEILDFYYPGTATDNAGASYVKVALAAYTPTTSLTIWNPAGRSFRLGNLNAETTQHAGRWTVSVSGQTVTLTRRATPGGSVLETRSYQGVVRLETLGEVGVIIAGSESATTGRWYRGDVRIEPTGGTGFNVTNSLPMEDYLKSVVPRESPASWLPAALQAQAVAARSYALWRTSHSTLCDTTSCQVYYGYGLATAAGTLTTSYEDVRSDAAIAATAGTIRTYGGAVAFTEFSSSNGGWTRAGTVPYQVAKADPYTGTASGDPVTTWTATLSVASVASSCPSGGTLRQLVVLDRDGNGPLGGRVTRVRLDCSTGSTEIANPAFGLRSTWWKLHDNLPRLDSPAVSATTINYGAQMSVAATPSVTMPWKLTVRDQRTQALVFTSTGLATAGVRFNATWFGRSSTGKFVGAGPYRVELSAADGAGHQATPYAVDVEVLPAPDPAAPSRVPLVGNVGYVAIAPARLVDTRLTFDSIGAGQRVDVKVAGLAGVPATGASAVVLNVTAVGATTETHLRIWPAGLAMPNASTLNTGPGRAQAALTTVGLGGEGKISIYNAIGSMHYLVDVVGYYTSGLASSSRYHAVDPMRAMDSRAPGSAPFTDGTTRQIDVASLLGVAASDVTAVTANITTTQAAGAGYVVAYGSGALPSTSTVNLLPGSDVANRAVVPVVGGKITIAAKGASVHAIVDIVGWYGAAGSTSGALFTPIQPARLLDTRVTASPFGPAETRSLVVTAGGVPANATAVVGVLTATNQTAVATHARVWPAGRGISPASDLNSGSGRTQANAVAVRIGSGGAVMLYNNLGSSDLLFDAVGYFR